jgi:putative glutamine amidotransferase
MIGALAFHAVGEKYIVAVTAAAGATPLLIPALGEEVDWDEMFGLVDGILLTGSHSNVAPHHYAGEASAPGTLHDPERDATTLALIPRALAAGVPLFAICRGFQEMNVALGGSLHQKVHLMDGLMDHREDETLEVDEDRYRPAHEVRLTPGGMLADIAGAETMMVNSLHEQGVDRLAPGLDVEAVAPDGLVEAFRVHGVDTFNLAVQWHPEWRATENLFSSTLFRRFGEACRRRAVAG